jgi:chromosome segregation ATPase
MALWAILPEPGGLGGRPQSEDDKTMTDDVLDFLRERFARVDRRFDDIEKRMDSIEHNVRELSYGQTVLTEMVLRLARDMVQMKDMLGRLDNRLARLETATAP